MSPGQNFFEWNTDDFLAELILYGYHPFRIVEIIGCLQFPNNLPGVRLRSGLIVQQRPGFIIEK
jgi:hypothetical protein